MKTKELLKKRFTIYALTLHVLVGFSFVIFDNENENEKKIENKRVVEIDISSPKQDDFVNAKSYSEEDMESLLNSIKLSNMKPKERLKLEEQREKEKAMEAARRNDIKKKLAEEKLRKQKEKRHKEKLAKEKLAKEKLAKEKLAKEKLELDKKEKIRKEKLRKQKIEREKKEKDRKEKEILRQKELNKKWMESEDGASAIYAYSSSLKSKVYGKWIRPHEAKNGWECKIQITQDKSGRIKSIKKINCNPNNHKFYNSVYNAVMSSSPLPVPSDDRIFDKNIYFVFTVE